MTQTANPVFSTLGHNATREAERSKAVYRTLSEALGALGFSAVWGFAAGAAAPLHALANIYKVPMVLALSLLVSLPAVLVTRHLVRAEVPVIEFIACQVRSAFRAALLLLGFAPLLLVYAYTSQWVAPYLAQSSAFFALACGAISLYSELSKLEAARWQVLLLGLVAVVTLALSLLQLISLATPILTLPTAFGAGIDGVLR